MRGGAVCDLHRVEATEPKRSAYDRQGWWLALYLDEEEEEALCLEHGDGVDNWRAVGAQRIAPAWDVDADRIVLAVRVPHNAACATHEHAWVAGHQPAQHGARGGREEKWEKEGRRRGEGVQVCLKSSTR